MDSSPKRFVTVRLAGLAGLFVAVFIGCVLSSLGYHDAPPFDDQATGLWSEASFLAETDFDYRRLRYQETYFMDAPDPSRLSRRTFMVSVLPSLLALLMRATPNARDTLVAAHLVEFACAAVVGVCMAVVLRKHLSRVNVALAIVALFTTPIWRVQVEMVGMEMPLTACLMVWFLLLSHHHYVAAVLAAGATFLVKASGGVTLLVNMIYLICMLLSSGNRRSDMLRDNIVRALIANMLVLAAAVSLVYWGGTIPHFGETEVFPIPKVFYLPFAFRSFPDILVLLILAGAGSVLACTARNAKVCQPAQQTPPTTTARTSSGFHSLQNVLFLSGLTIVLQLLAMSQWIALPRYFISQLPLVYISIGIAFNALPLRRWLLPAMFLGFIVTNVWNWDGRFYPSITSLASDVLDSDAYLHVRNCAFVERSLEYRDEHDSTCEAIELLQSRYANRPLLVPWPYLYHVLLPRLGYVSAPLDAVNAGDFSIALRRFVEAAERGDAACRDRAPVLVWTNLSRVTLPPFTTDEIVFEGAGTTPLVIYVKTLSPDIQSRKDIEDWYLRQTWPGPWLAQRALGRVNYLRSANRTSQAVAEIDQALAQDSTATPAMRRLLFTLRNSFFQAENRDEKYP